MSEKKTTSKKVHTLTLEDQTKLAQANVKKMEQGKIEVMKVVEGVQGAEKLAELIERGKKNGKLSSSELMDVLENLDLESDQMEQNWPLDEIVRQLHFTRQIKLNGQAYFRNRFLLRK